MPVFKNMPFEDGRIRLQFRVEACHAINHTQFTTVGSASAANPQQQQLARRPMY
jgi:hypothetical protein